MSSVSYFEARRLERLKQAKQTKPVKADFGKNWKEYLRQWLGKPAINVLERYFLEGGIKKPGLQHVLNMQSSDFDRAIISSHSVEAIKDLMLFQQQNEMHKKVLKKAQKK